jgi:hypothetical protein
MHKVRYGTYRTTVLIFISCHFPFREAHLAATEAEDLEEAAAPPGEVLDDPAVHVHLELEEVHLLPVGAVQRQHVPRLGHLQQESLILKVDSTVTKKRWSGKGIEGYFQFERVNSL